MPLRREKYHSSLSQFLILDDVVGCIHFGTKLNRGIIS
jgi:hypothetical protein